jgi:hypothetical protein
MVDSDDVPGYGAAVAGLTGAALAIARFGTYIDVVNNSEVEFLASLSWWSSFAAGVGLLGVGVAGAIDEDEGGEVALAVALVGLLVLVLMQASPAAGFDLGQLFG